MNYYLESPEKLKYKSKVIDDLERSTRMPVELTFRLAIVNKQTNCPAIPD